MDSAPWLDVVCSWCCDRSDDDRPCSEDCERLAVRAARTRRIVGLVDAIARATKLRRQYVEERIPGDRRIEQVDAIVADYDRQIHEAVTAQQRDDGHDATGQPMLRLWTDGRDVVVARDVSDVPSTLDRHYRVTGHTLRHACWKEVPPGQVVPLREAFNGVAEICSAVLESVGRPAWIGRAR